MKTTQEQTAIERLRSAGIDVKTADFHTLSGAQVDAVTAWADECKYRKPRNANGSRGRYFFARLARIAKAKA